MSAIDEVVGANIARFRGEMSQSEVAKKMVSHGFKWSQTTVWEVEKGKRALKFAEALDLAKVLGVTISDLGRDEDKAELLSEAMEASGEWIQSVNGALEAKALYELKSRRLYKVAQELRVAAGEVKDPMMIQYSEKLMFRAMKTFSAALAEGRDAVLSPEPVKKQGPPDKPEVWAKK
ncbi:UNVERIFIED_CONTAM: helix-turn-helix transcriptional regulator [Actinomycetes bacterium ARC8]|nr:helix-turn-helix transcriptional regulator [Actinomycetes bacterium ARC8]